jgi:hypothetical protein
MLQPMLLIINHLGPRFLKYTLYIGKLYFHPLFGVICVIFHSNVTQVDYVIDYITLRS